MPTRAAYVARARVDGTVELWRSADIGGLAAWTSGPAECEGVEVEYVDPGEGLNWDSLGEPFLACRRGNCGWQPSTTSNL